MPPCSSAPGSHFPSSPLLHTVAQADSQAIPQAFEGSKTIEISLGFLLKSELMGSHGAKPFSLCIQKWMSWILSNSGNDYTPPTYPTCPSSPGTYDLHLAWSGEFIIVLEQTVIQAPPCFCPPISQRKRGWDGEAKALRLANYGLLLGVGVRGLGDTWKQSWLSETLTVYYAESGTIVVFIFLSSLDLPWTNSRAPRSQFKKNILLLKAFPAHLGWAVI